MPNNISVDGNSIVISNATITIDNAFDPTTGVATITITPLGGLGSLPALLEGESGPSCGLRNVNLTEVASGDALPSPPASFTTIIPPGQPGVPALYDLNLAVHSGEQGETGSFLIRDAEDFAGSLVNGAVLVWDAVAGAFNLTQIMLGTYNWPTVANSTSGTTSGPRTLAQVTVAAQNWAWYPKVSGQTIITGTDNTQVNITANIGSASGPQVGAGFGVAGVPTQTIVMSSGPPAGSSSGYNQIAANTQATIVFSATQVGSNTDSWSTSYDTTLFSVESVPVA